MPTLRNAVLIAALVTCDGDTAHGQSLRGSRASVDRMFTRAIGSELDFYRTSKSIYGSVKDGELVLISITADLALEDVSYPFALPKTLEVVNDLAKRYRAACGERLVVTSAARPRGEQPRNASVKSVHPTGMAVDFRRPTGNCLTWMRKELVLLERQGVLEATEERRPVHFHVAVLQRGLSVPAAAAVATATKAPALVAPGPVVSAVTGSADGEVVPAEPSAPSTYAVRKGDTLSEIAKKFGTSVARLRSINGLKSSTIRAGQKLRVK